MTSEAEWLESFTRTFPKLRAWGVRIASGVPLPAPGSDLAVDDQDWPWHSVSMVAWSGLCSARDHLHGVRLLYEAHQYLPWAQPTLARSALIGASQAVWVLESDDRATRLQRARAIAYDGYANHARFAALQAKHPTAEQPAADNLTEHVSARREQLRAKRRADGDNSTRLDVTRVVEQAAEAAFGALGPEHELETMLAWRSTSGSAHGLMWALTGRRDTAQTGTPDELGIAEFTASGGIEVFANAYLAAFWMAVKGWQLFDRRLAKSG